MPPTRSSNANRPRDRFQSAQALHQAGRLADAEAIYNDILRLHPGHLDALHFLGVIALQTSRTELGLRLIEKAVGLQPKYAEALGNLGLGYADLRRYQDALASYDRALALKPDLVEVHDNRGNALRNLKRYDEAVASHERAIALRPDYAEAHSNRGNALYDLHRYTDALASQDKALALQPGFLEAHCNRGIALGALKRYDEALASFDNAIALNPNHAEAHNSRGNALRDLRRPAAAIASFSRAIALRPGYAEAHNNLGNALQDLQRYDEALVSYAKAIALLPGYAQAYYNRGNAEMASWRIEDALRSYDMAIALQPDYAAAYHNRGVALINTQRYQAALVSYDKAIALRPDYADALHDKGSALHILGRYQDALASFEKALAIDPDTKSLLGDYLFTQRQICQWTSNEAVFAAIVERIKLGQESTLPFPMLAFSDSAALQNSAARIFVNARHPAIDAVPAVAKRAEHDRHTKHGRIRLGYFSADFRDHAMMHLMVDVFARHDRSKFEVTAFSFGPDSNDVMHRRAGEIFDRFIDVRTMPDRDVALLARRMEIDIAVNLMGFTTLARTGIFSSRAAPVQVNYLGYPGTMAANYIDYIIADRILIAPGAAQYFSEQMVFLPNSYQANDRNRPIASPPVTRAEHGLPERGFVFCCFNNNFKIVPLVFDCWMRILESVAGSVLWLFEDNADAVLNLRREAVARGIDAERLIFAKRLPSSAHLARHRLADLFLDTLPYNAHTTASDALWAGLPVLTQMGQTFAGRVAASLLSAVGLPELITTTPEDYATLAVELATHPDKLSEIRDRLHDNRLVAPLFDSALFTRHLEAAYAAMHQRYQAGLPPTEIDLGHLEKGGGVA